MDLTIGHRKLMQYSWGDLPINRTNCNQKLDNKPPDWEWSSVHGVFIYSLQGITIWL